MKILLALIAGGTNAVAFAPFNEWLLGLLSFAILFFLWLGSNKKQAWLIGFAFGLGMFSVGVSWIYISLHTFGGMPPVIAGLCVFILIAYLSLFPAFCGWIQGVFSGRSTSVRLVIIMPCLWILSEWLRGWLFTGFPWLTTGYAYLDTPLSNYAPIGGVYLVGLIILVSIGSVVAFVRQFSISSALIMLLVSGIWVGGWQLNETAWTEAQGEPIDVAIIQNNIPILDKWDDAKKNEIVQGYVSQSMQYQDVDLIVWPEAAIPDFFDNVSPEFWVDLKTHPADFILGMLYREEQEDSIDYYNSAVALSEQVLLYRKQHLVPFGEYIPMQGILQPVIDYLNIPMSNFSTWKQPQGPLIAADSRFAVSICYEDAFPNEWRSQIPDAGSLINISEDIWFGDSFAPHQRLQMARFRSRESERPMIRSSNNGLSSLINWKGGVDEYAPQFRRAVVTGPIQPREGITPYIVFGDKIIFSVLLGLFVLGLLFGRRKTTINRS